MNLLKLQLVVNKHVEFAIDLHHQDRHLLFIYNIYYLLAKQLPSAAFLSSSGITNTGTVIVYRYIQHDQRCYKRATLATRATLLAS